MGKRGPKPKNTISTDWSANLAYAVGLIASDGCLYNDGRHMALASNDLEQINNFKHCLGLQIEPKPHISGFGGPLAHRLQFGGVVFYSFLLSIGLMPAKSKIMEAIDIPDEFFFDFLRGSFDGDGCFNSYWDPRWRSSHMFYTSFTTGSKKHVEWLRQRISDLLGIKGSIDGPSKKDVYSLRYAKKESLELIKKMYYSQDVVSLSRKRLKIQKALAIEAEQQAKYF